MENILLLGGIGVVALVEIIIKLAKESVASRWLPVVGVLSGLILGAIASITSEVSLVDGLVGGFIAGATALGLYDVRSKSLRGE